MARRGLLSWLTGGAVETVRDVPVLGWLIDKVVPDAPIEQSKKAAEKEARKVPKAGKAKPRKKATPKPRLTTGPGASRGNGSPPVASSPQSTKPGTSAPFAGSKARQLQVQFSNPFATRAEREAAMRQWLKIHPKPGEAGLTPNEMAAFRDAYALTEHEKW